MSEATAPEAEVRKPVRSDGICFGALAALSLLMGGLMLGTQDELARAVLVPMYRLTGLIASAVGFALWDSELPAALRFGGVVGLLLPWFALLA